MDTKGSRKVALLSIRPDYTEQIVNGTKQVEFRRTLFPTSLEHIVIYCTTPLQKVVGFFSISNIIHAAPEVLWDKYQDVGGISEDAFRSYYSGCNKGTAIEIGKLFTLRTAISLQELDTSLTAPQCIRYLAPDYIRVLRTYRRRRILQW